MNMQRKTSFASSLSSTRQIIVGVVRSLRRQRGYTTINVTGLSLGLACSLAILSFVFQETSFDRFHEKYDDIYRLTLQVKRESGTVWAATSSPPMGPAIAAGSPDVVHAVRFRDPNVNHLVSVGQKHFYERELMYADPSFFAIFSFGLRSGDPSAALSNPSSVVLSDEAGRKYFGASDPIGQRMTIADAEYTVSGVMDPFPETSHIRFDVLLPFKAFKVPSGYPVTLDDWGWTSFYTYLELRPGSDPVIVEGQANRILADYMPPRSGTEYRLVLQPLGDVYLDDPLAYHASFAPSGNRTMTYGLAAIALLILGIAFINFMNLAVAQSARRSREIAIRKVLGASRAAVVGSVIGESILLSLASLGIAFGLVEATMQTISAAVGRPLSMSAVEYIQISPIVLGLVILSAGAAGLYPSLLLSRVPSSLALKGTFNVSGIGRSFRRGLLFLQCVAFAGLLVVGAFVNRQIDFVTTKSLGFDKERVIVLRMQGADLQAMYPRIRGVLQSNPHVAAVGRGGMMLDGQQGAVPFIPEGAPKGMVYSVALYGVYPGFCSTLGISVIEGREFSDDRPTDSAQAMMVNRAAVAMFGWKDPLGKRLQWVLGSEDSRRIVRDGVVVGVTDDFHFSSLRESVAPLVMIVPSAQVENIFVRLNPGDRSEILSSLERDWGTIAGAYPFSFTFLDDHLDALYRTERTFASVLDAFTWLAGAVASMGLVGLVSFAVERRRKEIALRRVLGADVIRVLGLVLREFIIVCAAANLLAWPIAYFIMIRWVESFAYRVSWDAGIFLQAGIISVLLVATTVFGRALRAVASNPVESLRYE